MHCPLINEMKQTILYLIGKINKYKDKIKMIFLIPPSVDSLMLASGQGLKLSGLATAIFGMPVDNLCILS